VAEQAAQLVLRGDHGDLRAGVGEAASRVGARSHFGSFIITSVPVAVSNR